MASLKERGTCPVPAYAAATKVPHYHASGHATVPPRPCEKTTASPTSVRTPCLAPISLVDAIFTSPEALRCKFNATRLVPLARATLDACRAKTRELPANLLFPRVRRPNNPSKPHLPSSQQGSRKQTSRPHPQASSVGAVSARRMTTTQATPQPTSGGDGHHPASSSSDNSSSGSSSSTKSSSWIPPIPRPLESLFAAVPLVVYAANNLPSGCPPPSSLPALHVFASDHDAARGLPSFNPSCLKWQTYLLLASIPHRLVSSTNHASPTGALPFLQPAIATGPEARLDARQLLPIPSTRLDSYVRQHGSLPSSRSSISPAKHKTNQQTPDQRHHRQQAYQALLDTSIRNAWLYTLYLAPANEPLLRDLYINPISRSTLIRATLLQQLRTAARAEIGKSNETTSSSSSSSSNHNAGGEYGGSIGSKLFTWALGGRTTVNAEAVYAAARSALLALEMLLVQSASDSDIERQQNWDDQDEDDLATNNYSGGAASAVAAAARGGPWFFSSPHPTLFDASVFSYTYLILDGDRYSGSTAADASAGAGHQGEKDTHWGDDTLRQILIQECPHLVAHVRRIVERCWGNAQVDGLKLS